MRLEFQVALGISFSPRKVLLLLKHVGPACENLEIFGRGEFVICGFALDDVNGLAKEFENASFVSWRKVEGFFCNAHVELLEQINARCLRCLRKPNFTAVDCAFDAAIACYLDGVNRWFCNESAAFVHECVKYIADDFFAYKRARDIVHQNVFGATRKCVYAVLYGLPTFGSA